MRGGRRRRLSSRHFTNRFLFGFLWAWVVRIGEGDERGEDGEGMMSFRFCIIWAFYAFLCLFVGSTYYIPSTSSI